MGYTTDFKGRFELDRPLRPEHAAYLKRFSDSRRMKRDPAIAALIPDPLRVAVALPVGDEGGYFVGTDEADKDVYEPGDPRHVTPELLMAREGYRQRDAAVSWADVANKEAGFAGQRRDASVMGYNGEPVGQPGLWCQWIPSEDGRAIEWNGGEKFYHYVEWLEYLIEHFLGYWDYVVNGRIQWQGEGEDDKGEIVVTDNRVEAIPAAREAV